MKIITFGFASCMLIFTFADLRSEEIFSFPVQYSAELTAQTEGGQGAKTRVYVDGEKMRMEMNSEGMETITIIRRDQKVCHSLMPAQKMCMTIPITVFEKKVEHMFLSHEKFQFLGKETIRNRACDKYKVTVEKEDFFMWVDVSTRVPVRQASADGKNAVDWDHFKMGPQSANLFEVPADYQKMDMNALQGLQKE